jgi:hypothetical protein
MTEFQPHAIAITGLDLWLYRQNGPLAARENGFVLATVPE